MHTNPTFRKTAPEEALRFARLRAFGTLVAQSPQTSDSMPLLSHVPFLLAEDGATAELHLTRSNPIARAAQTSCAATLCVLGPDGYISPDWYGLDDQVPTWNYTAVHLKGTLHPLPPETLPDMLARQSAAFETYLPGKAPWTMDKMSQETTARFLRMILPFRLDVDAIDSTFKLNQNKPEEARKRAAQEVTNGYGSELEALADLMRNPPAES